MKRLITIVLTCLLVFQSGFGLSESLRTDDKPRIIILATGGTIAGSGASSTDSEYTAGEIPVDSLTKAVPGLEDKASIETEQIANIGSQDMTDGIWLKLSKRVNAIFENDEADGVVITHGTDTQEETAYFLSLTVDSDKPVVLVGAMRPATAISADGNRNLLDAVTVAADEKSQDIGTVVAMNEKVFAARDVTKTSTTNVATFQSNDFGPIGLVHSGKVDYYYKSLRAGKKVFDVQDLEELPEVEIAYGYEDASPKAISAFIKANVDGIVFAGVGNGNFNKPVGRELGKAADQGIIVCRSARAGSGQVTLHNEVDDEKMGFIVADDLNPQKARILLKLALTETDDREEIQNMFFKY